jgi:hypothetical protein
MPVAWLLEYGKIKTANGLLIPVLFSFDIVKFLSIHVFPINSGDDAL